jgi:DNA invertase Pin-like site-specific DNA recombinase
MLSESQIKLACSNCDCDDEIRDGLEEMLIDAREKRDRLGAMRIRRVLRSRRLFGKLESEIKTAAATRLVASGVAVKENGEILKYLVEWFTENWETIIEFIKAIVAIF